MGTLRKHRTLLVGILAPVASAFFGGACYMLLTRASQDRDSDWMFRLSMTALAMALPFVVTMFSAIADRRASLFGTSAKIGLALGVLSLGLTWWPIDGAINRARQARNLALRGQPAPPMETVDIHGKNHRLSDHAGKVILLNIWATWCPPCRKEMPELDRLYQERADEGFMVFGLSTEDLDTQLEFNEKYFEVSYPLLTVAGEVPEIYRTTARYPANFLIDRQGRLQPAPSTDQPFEKLEEAVEALLVEPAP